MDLAHALPDTPIALSPTGLPPTPDEDPEAWATLHIGTYTITGDVVAFLVELEGAELKTDDQKASGTDKAKTKISGVDNAKGKIAFRWCRTTPGADQLMFQVMMGLDPNGPAKGKPQDVGHPEFALRRVPQIVVKKWEKLDRKGDWRENVLLFSEWTDPPKAVAGATTTPKDAQAATTTVTGFGSNGNTVGLPGVVKGFNPGSGSAPATSP
jgi:hypothetical protein